MCYEKGKIQLAELPIPPELPVSLLNGISQDFLQHIRAYNNCFVLTLFEAKEATLPGLKSTFRYEGQVHHKIGSLLSLSNEPHQFLQIHFIEDYKHKYIPEEICLIN